MLLLPKLHNLPKTLPIEGAVSIELFEGIPLFRASSTVQNRIEELLEKQQTSPLNSDEEQELDLYEEIDDYLSFINRTVRNLYLTQSQSDVSQCLLVAKSLKIFKIKFVNELITCANTATPQNNASM
jgi:hypothetical protein